MSGTTSVLRASLESPDDPGPGGPLGSEPAGNGPVEDGSPENRSTEGGPTERGAGRRGRRTVVVAAAGVALVLGGMLAVDAWQGRSVVERLRAAPGGLEPLPDAPVERWTADVEVSGGLALLPGAVVTVEDGTAVARSLDDGAERWRVDVGAHASCGGQLLWSLPFGEPASTLVCVAPSSDAVGLGGVTDLQLDPETGRVLASDWAVTVLAADGEVLGRRDTTSGGGTPVPGTGGTLLRAQRVGGVPAGDGAVVEQDVATGEVADLPWGAPPSSASRTRSRATRAGRPPCRSSKGPDSASAGPRRTGRRRSGRSSRTCGRRPRRTSSVSRAAASRRGSRRAASASTTRRTRWTGSSRSRTARTTATRRGMPPPGARRRPHRATRRTPSLRRTAPCAGRRPARSSCRARPTARTRRSSPRPRGSSSRSTGTAASGGARPRWWRPRRCSSPRTTRWSCPGVPAPAG